MAYNPFSGFAPGMPGAGTLGDFAANPADWQRNFETLSRQYWSAWGDALRAASGQPASPPAMPGWQDAVEWWSKLAHGGRTEANDLAERFNAQARHWFGQMQQVAAQFAGQDHSAGQVADAWKKALGAAGENPFPEIFRAMRSHGQQGLDQWVEDASPYLDAFRREGLSWLSLPAFGVGREHQERLQALARAQVDYQEKNAAYNALMAKSGQRAFELFEHKLSEREEPGKQITSARALFDLWIDSAEESYAQIALSPEFRQVYGALVNAQMRLRNGIQKEVELTCGLFGMPTRTEVDAAHRKVAELERQLRRLRDAAAPRRVPDVPTPRVMKRKMRPATSRMVVEETPSRPAKPSKTVKPVKPVKAAKRAARAAARPAARKIAPAALLQDIAMPVAPDAKLDASKRASNKTRSAR